MLVYIHINTRYLLNPFWNNVPLYPPPPTKKNNKPSADVSRGKEVEDWLKMG